MDHVLDSEHMYDIHQDGLPDMDFWMGDEDTSDVSHLPTMTAIPLMDVLGTSDHSSYYSAYTQYPQTVSMSNPVLSRSIFDVQDALSVAATMAVEDHNYPWSALTSSPPQTIAPRAAFQPMLVSSPIAKQEPSTPIRMGSHSSVMFSSSPMGLVSPPVVPSQHDVDEATCELTEHNIDASELARHRCGIDRLHRRGYERKRHVGPANRPKPVGNRSGMHCDVVIAQNEFACSYAGCQKRFKRQEHKKRHEKTVHEKA